MATIVFIGNCQLEGVSGVYRKFVASRTGETVHYVPSYAQLTGEAHDRLTTADVVVIQLQDLQPTAELPALRLPGRQVLIPTVTAHFLWPYNKMETHPQAIENSHFARDLSDHYLNQAILRGEDPELTVQRYLDLDIAKRINLQRLFELIIDRQLSRDRQSGFDMADYIAGRFRDESLFMTPYHMDMPVFQRLMTQLLQKLDIDKTIIRRLNTQVKTPPFVPDYLPIHPSVCRHFGLRFISADHRYKFCENRVSTRTFYLRYMKNDCQLDFIHGIKLLGAGQEENALLRLQAAVRHAPDCAYAYNLIAVIHRRRGNLAEAQEAIEIAARLDPDDPRCRDTYARILEAKGDLAGAQKMLEIAVHLASNDLHYRLLLVGVLRRQGKLQDAISATEAAIRLDPYSMLAHCTMIMLTKEAGSLAQADALLTDALALDPEDGPLHCALAELRHAQGDGRAAIDAVRTALHLAPNDRLIEHRCAALLAQSDLVAEATQELRAMIRRNGSNAGHHDCLAHALERHGMFQEAIAAQHRAIELAPDNASYARYLDHLLRRVDRMREVNAQAAEPARSNLPASA